MIERNEPALEGYDHIARLHVYAKCIELDVTWAEVEAMLVNSEVIEEHFFDDLMVKQVRLLGGWIVPLHTVHVVHHDRRLVVCRTVYVPTLERWKPGFRERRS